MAKLTKTQIKQHEEACKILEKESLTFDDKLFVLANWNEGANNNNAQAGAFFTPYLLARDFKLEIYEQNNKIIDLCSGIGALSLPHYSFCEMMGYEIDITCVELNHSYLEVGKKILPKAKWVQGSALDLGMLKGLGHFNQCISNPPFGKIKTDDNKNLKYKGSEFELKIMEIGSYIADYGTFLVPQNSTPFRYSGRPYFEDLRYEDDGDRLPNKVKKFIKETGLNPDFNVGIDTSIYLKDWKGVSPLCEVVNFKYSKT
ncbi:methyltransferase [Marinifilum sp. N1E240]|uniref:methyltransferase n=1 Tax=Marinifilum sp. N1E240 TaxID=2608082 RepID=UPI00128E7818|nr:methyltransferase [Marinifilum sp. N1E240]MPQ46881.1 methyltransferase [Marinifilum sp. N1E240]